MATTTVDLGSVIGPKGDKGDPGLSAVRNWLDNSDFTNPVNQRNITAPQTQTVTKQYYLDRWYFANYAPATYELSSAGLHIATAGTTTDTVWFTQKLSSEAIAALCGKTVTLAFSTSAGIFTLTKVFPETSYYREGVKDTIYLTIGNNWVDICGPFDVTLYWAALYEGAYTADTLPAYVPKGYAAELAECQRYYYAVKGSKPLVLAGMFDSAGCLDVCWPLPVQMRVTPTLTFYRLSSGAWTSGAALLGVNGTTSGITPGSAYYYDTGFAGLRYINSSYANKACYVTFGFTASADL